MRVFQHMIIPISNIDLNLPKDFLGNSQNPALNIRFPFKRKWGFCGNGFIYSEYPLIQVSIDDL